MKAILKKLACLTISFATLASVCAISASGYYKRDYERLFTLYTNKAASAPDLTSISSDVTLPQTASGMDFYCVSSSGGKTIKMTLRKSSLASGGNSALLGEAGTEARIAMVSNWYDANGSSRVVGFNAAIQSPDLNSNCSITAVAW